MKYDPRRKRERNDDLVQYRNKHRYDSWREIGERYGISSQRARVIYLRSLEIDRLRQGG